MSHRVVLEKARISWKNRILHGGEARHLLRRRSTGERHAHLEVLPITSRCAYSSLKKEKYCNIHIIPCCQRQNGILAQRNLDTRFLLRNGLLCYAVSLRIRNLSERSQTIMGCPMKPSGEPFLLLAKPKEHEHITPAYCACVAKELLA